MRVQRNLRMGDVVRPKQRYWDGLRVYLGRHYATRVDPPICIVVVGDEGDGVICVLGCRGPNMTILDSAAFYNLLSGGPDYGTSRVGKPHVLASGLIEWAAINYRKAGDFETAVWLDEQQHQVDAGNYAMGRYLVLPVPRVALRPPMGITHGK